MTDFWMRRSRAVAVIGAVLFGFAASPAMAGCGDVAALADAGVVTEAKRDPTPAQACSDGGIRKLSAGQLLNQRAKRLPSGGYVLPDLNVRVSSAMVSVSGQAAKAQTCRGGEIAYGDKSLGLGHGGCN